MQFDRAVVPGSVSGRFTVSPSIPNCDVSTAFTAPADAPCRIRWLSGNSEFVLQHPGAILLPDQQYTFTLRGGFRDPVGAVNTVDHSWFLTTAGAPMVRAVNPADGSAGVPVDSPLTIDFNSGMAAATTEPAIHLDPPVPGTRVIPNTKDHSRFMVLPGHLLISGIPYRLSVDRTATDLHGQALAAGVSASFTTGGLSPGGHGVVLAAANPQGATEIIVTSLSAVEDGLPIATETALAAPSCAVHSGCGIAAAGAPLYTYTSAILSPDHRWLAVVEQDQTVPGAPSTLVVLDAAAGAIRTAISGAALPSWSPGGSLLAYQQGSSVRIYRPADGRTTQLPDGDALVAPPAWGPASELLVLNSMTSSGSASEPHVELADTLVGARYALPGVSGPATAPVVSPDGTLVALYRTGTSRGTWLAGVGASSAAPRRLDPNLTPLGFTDPGTLVALAAPPGGNPAIVRVSISGDEQIALPGIPGAPSAPVVVVSPSGRQLAYLARAPSGRVNAYVENADGSNPTALTAFTSGTFDAVSVTLTG